MGLSRRLGLALCVGLVLMVVGAAFAAAMVNRTPVTAPRSIQVTCGAGSKRAVIAGRIRCLRSGQACKTRHQTAYRKYGFRCVNGRLRKRSTPPTPAPRAQSGHYKGTDSQNELIEFDVNTTRDGVQNFSTGQINAGCTPPLHLAGGNVQGGSAEIAADSSFKIDFDYPSTIGGNPYTGHVTITGHFSGTTATGTMRNTLSFTLDGIQYSCESGLLNWTATRTP
jgi:hypothetical protein